MVEFSGQLVDPCAISKDFKNKNVNSDTSSPHSLRSVHYVPFPVSHGSAAPGLVPYRLTLTLWRKVLQTKVVQLDLTNNFYSGYFFLKVKGHESLDKTLNSRFSHKILIIRTWVSQMT